MKKITLIIVVLAFFMNAKAQTVFFEDFQNGIPSTFMLIDNDGLTPAANVAYVNDAWIAYPDFNNPADTAALSTSWYSPAGSSDDWMITPKISLTSNNFLIWRAYAPDQSYQDGYEVKISTTDSAMTSFTNLLTVAAENSVWTTHSIDLSAYSNQPVYIAFRNNSNDKFLLFVDDIEIKTVNAYDMEGLSSSMQTPVDINNAPFSVEGTLKNVGSTALTSFNLNYSINNGTPVTQAVTGVNVAAFADYNFIHSTVWNPATAGLYTVRIWASDLNGPNADMYNGNDTITTIVSVANQSTQRIPLYEEFTSSTCGPCASAHVTFTPLMNANMTKWAMIKYQMSWPGNGDPYFTAEGELRRNYYGVSSVPDLYVDGGHSYAGGPGSYTVNDINSAYAKPAFLNITSSMVVNANNSVQVQVTLDPIATFPPGSQLFVGIVEKETTANVASNGETEFEFVMKKMIPDANGTAVTLNDGVQVIKDLSYTFNGNYRLPSSSLDPINHAIEHSVEEFKDLTAVVWVQNVETKKVYQAAYASVTSGLEDNTNDIVSRIYPNPATDNINLELNLLETSNVAYMVMNSLGQNVMEENLGNLHQGFQTKSINISGLEKGLYFVKINVNDNLITKKLIVE